MKRLVTILNSAALASAKTSDQKCQQAWLNNYQQKNHCLWWFLIFYI